MFPWGLCTIFPGQVLLMQAVSQYMGTGCGDMDGMLCHMERLGRGKVGGKRHFREEAFGGSFHVRGCRTGPGALCETVSARGF